MDIPSIQNEYNRLKLQGKQLHSNYYFQEIPAIFTFRKTPNTYLFICEEPDLYRLYYFTTDLIDFTTEIHSVKLDKPIVIDLLHSDPDYSAEFRKTIEASGFHCIAEFNRMECKKIRNFFETTEINYAVENDLENLHQLLFQVFNPYIDHLPTQKLLLEYIKNRNVVVSRKGNDINGLIIFQIQKKKAHFNFLYNNEVDPTDFISLINQYYAILRDQNINESYLWVEKNNSKVIKIHKLCGYSNDGLVNYIFSNTILS